MKKNRLAWVVLAPLVTIQPAWSQAILNQLGAQGAAIGAGAGLAASLNHGQAVVRSMESITKVQQMAVERTKMIEQSMKQGCDFEAKKQWANAEKAYNAMLEHVTHRDGPGSTAGITALKHLVNISQAQHNTNQAINYQKSVVTFTKRNPESTYQSILDAQIRLSKLYIQNQDYSSAAPVLEHSMAMDDSAKLPREQRRVALNTYAIVLRKLNKNEEAVGIEAKADALDTSKIGKGTTASPTTSSTAPQRNGAGSCISDDTPVTATRLGGSKPTEEESLFDRSEKPGLNMSLGDEPPPKASDLPAETESKTETSNALEPTSRTADTNTANPQSEITTNKDTAKVETISTETTPEPTTVTDTTAKSSSISEEKAPATEKSQSAKAASIESESTAIAAPVENNSEPTTTANQSKSDTPKDGIDPTSASNQTVVNDTAAIEPSSASSTLPPTQASPPAEARSKQTNEGESSAQEPKQDETKPTNLDADK